MKYEHDACVHPRVRDFWREIARGSSDSHALTACRFLADRGDALSRASFRWAVARTETAGLPRDIGSTSVAFHDAIEAEAGHERTLERIATRVVREGFQFDEVALEAHLNPDDITPNRTDEKYPIAAHDYAGLSRRLKDAIAKRILMNSLAQGAATHAFVTLHHLAAPELCQVSPALPRLYDLVSVGSLLQQWRCDLSSIVASPANLDLIALGSSSVDYPTGGTPHVIAKARTFPLLCHELVKGAVELISLHGLADFSEPELEAIYAFADRRVDEPRLIQVGGELWRRLLAFLAAAKAEGHEHSLPDTLMMISLMEADASDRFCAHVCDGRTAEALTILSDPPHP